MNQTGINQQAIARDLGSVLAERDALRAENEELRVENERHRDNSVWAADRIKALEAENERFKAEQTQYPFNVAVAARAELREAQVEIKQLREEMAEWESAHTAVVELRGLIESHMDAARGEWQCVAEIERLKQLLREHGIEDVQSLSPSEIAS